MAIAAFKLEEAGFKRDQIEALAEFVGGSAAGKDDLLSVQHELKGDITAVKHELKGDIADLQRKLEGDITGLRGEVNLLKWMVGLSIAMNLTILIKLFVH